MARGGLDGMHFTTVSLSIYIYIIYNLQFETSLGFHSPAAEGHPIS